MLVAIGVQRVNLFSLLITEVLLVVTSLVRCSQQNSCLPLGLEQLSTFACLLSLHISTYNPFITDILNVLFSAKHYF